MAWVGKKTKEDLLQEAMTRAGKKAPVEFRAYGLSVVAENEVRKAVLRIASDEMTRWIICKAKADGMAERIRHAAPAEAYLYSQAESALARVAPQEVRAYYSLSTLEYIGLGKLGSPETEENAIWTALERVAPNEARALSKAWEVWWRVVMIAEEGKLILHFLAAQHSWHDATVKLMTIEPDRAAELDEACGEQRSAEAALRNVAPAEWEALQIAQKAAWAEEWKRRGEIR